MQWVTQYQLFLFDFDGLLVDTEPLHYAAYKELLLRHGYDLSWDFDRYCKEAHGGGSSLEECRPMSIWDGLQKEFPTLFDQESRDQLYVEKKRIYVELLQSSILDLMPGFEDLLKTLSELKIKCAVVTNSPHAHIEMIKNKIPSLQLIPNWITREDYTLAKPSAESYLKAIEKWAEPNDRIIGFEDSAKGLKALLSAGVEAVLICPSHYAHVEQSKALGVKHFTSLSQFCV